MGKTPGGVRAMATAYHFDEAQLVATHYCGAGNQPRMRAASYDPESRGGQAADGRKVKGTIHWVCAERSLPATVRIYDRLFLHEAPDGGGRDFKSFLNPSSLEVLAESRVEPSVAGAEPGTSFQFERQGYFVVDPDTAGDALVFRGDQRHVYRNLDARRSAVAITVVCFAPVRG